MANYLKYSRGSGAKETPIERLEELQLQAMEIIKKFRSVSTRNVIAYSGGKDSIVASFLAVKLGINKSISEVSFMFPKSMQEAHDIGLWLGLEMNKREGLSWEWLKKNQQYCAPPMSIQSGLYGKRQQKTVKNFAKKNDFTGVLYGRRRQENSVPSPLYKLKSGQWQCHPLWNWTTDDIWTFINLYEIPYPSLYSHEIGKKEGFTPYLLPPEHFNGNVWKAINNYDPSILTKFAEFHEPARKYKNSL